MRWLALLVAWAGLVSGQHELAEDTDINEIRGYHKREHSLVKPYQASGLDIPFWDIVGSTMVSSTNIQLTPDQQSRSGAVWNKYPVKSRDWEVAITFRVSGSTGDLFGDGIAFWYAKEPNILGPVFGSKDHFHGLAVFLDTYSNHNGVHSHGHPYVSAMIANGTQAYDHDRDGTHTQLGGEDKGCEAKFRNRNHDSHILVRYVADTIQVYIDVSNSGLWTKCFIVPGVRLPAGYHLGVSAATGELSDAHDLIGLRTYELDVPRAEKAGEGDRYGFEPEAAHYAAPRDHVNDPRPSRLGGIGTFFLYLLGLVAVVGCVGVGIVMLQKRQEHSRKRFY